jgi:hypothetical protein
MARIGFFDDFVTNIDQTEVSRENDILVAVRMSELIV